MSMNTIEWSDQTLILPDILTVETIPAYHKALMKHRTQLAQLSVIDFTQVKKADSAVLALVLELAECSVNKVELRQLSSELKTLVTLYDLEPILLTA